MTESSFRSGDLVAIDPCLDRKGLHLELRSSNNKLLYEYPRLVVDPDSLLVVLGVDDRDTLVLTTKGQKGWIIGSALVIVQRRI